jgi:peptidoglycan lytic transglycosylase
MVRGGPVVEGRSDLLAGRHAVARTPGAQRHLRRRASRRSVRYLIPLTVALLVAAALGAISVTIGGLGGVLTSDRAILAEPPAASQAAPLSSDDVVASPSTSPSTGSPTATRAPQRASRGETRSARPSPRRSRTPSPSPTRASSVVTSGTCGVSYYETGSVTASGEPFDPDGFTAAHKTLAFDTRVRVTNTANGRSVVVRINDRGPFVSGRCLDLARGAFTAIASTSSGVITAKYEVLS